MLVHPHSKHRAFPLSLVKNPVSNLKKFSNYVGKIVAGHRRHLFQFVVAVINHLLSRGPLCGLARV